MPFFGLQSSEELGAMHLPSGQQIGQSSAPCGSYSSWSTRMSRSSLVGKRWGMAAMASLDGGLLLIGADHVLSRAFPEALPPRVSLAKVQHITRVAFRANCGSPGKIQERGGKRGARKPPQRKPPRQRRLSPISQRV
jgi:hypothetical protein